MRVSYYPGCSLRGTARDYEESLKAVCSLLEIELCEIEDWNCCGATAAHSLNHRASIHLPGRNLVLAERVGMDVVVPCPLCFNRLKKSEKELLGDRKDLYDVSIEGSTKIWDLANFLSREPVLERIGAGVKDRLEGLKAVCYYGCMASRPPEVTDESHYENPESMDLILKRLGVQVLDWSYKTDCCGASHLVARPDIVFQLVGRLFEEASRAGANCIAVSCQMCQANLDLHQDKILQQAATDQGFPVFYFTELIGLAHAHRDAAKWLKRHFVNPRPLLREPLGSLTGCKQGQMKQKAQQALHGP
jgi:heterodisulfide reductase subunit B